MGGDQSTSADTNLAKNPNSKKTKSDEEWRKVLNGTQFKVLRQKATDPRGITRAKGGWDDHYEKGTYICQACSTQLYTSDMKFDCGCGWPGFWTNTKDAVYESRDADGRRCEILCASCDSHLGHVFRGEGYSNPAPNERHCVNSSCLAFVPEGENDANAIRPTFDGL
jgi:peptide-methionine (R)-S-oxide reductase